MLELPDAEIGRFVFREGELPSTDMKLKLIFYFCFYGLIIKQVSLYFWPKSIKILPSEKKVDLIS